MFRFLVTFLVVLYYIPIVSQEPVAIHLSEKDGLPDKEFYNIIEDKQGFIWLCADKGLFRYDGKTFKNYTNKEKKGHSVFNLLEDNEGRIWCNNISGQFFYVEEGKLNTFIDLSLVLKGELTFFKVEKEHLIVFSQSVIYYINKNTKLIEKEHAFNTAISQPISIKKEMFIASIDSISVFNNKYDLKEKFSIKGKNESKLVEGRTKVFKIDSLLFINQVRGKINTFFKINFLEKKATKLENLKGVEKEQIYDVLNKDDQIWFSTTNGVWVYNWVNNKFKEERQFLKGKNVTKTITDKDGNFWFITLNNGVYVVPNIYIEKYAISEASKGISVLDKIDDHTLYFGSNNGNVGLYNIHTNTETTIVMPNKSRVSAIKYNPRKELSYIGKDINGYVLDHKTGLLKDVFKVSSVKNFLILENNDVHIVDHKNTYLLKEGNFKKLKYIYTNKRPYTSFYHKKDKSIYIAYVDGLVKNDSLRSSKTITYNNKPIYGLSITDTKDGILWVATFKDGIFGLKNDTVTHHFTTKNGLVSNRIEKIKADHNNLWIATDAGIQLLDTKTNIFKTLTKRDGIISYDISGIEIMKDKVVFSSSEGLFSVDKQNAFKEQKAVEVYFTEVEINEKETKLAANYKLGYNQNAIKFSFNVNGLKFNKKGKYKYRLLGFNKNWITTAIGETSVKYNSLPAGDYTFQVQPVLTETQIKNKIAALNFSIKNPFWKTWWFISGAVVFVFVSIILYYRRKIRKEEQQRLVEVKQLSLDKELIALKLENLRSQMNPHFIFNALNSIQEYIILNQKKLASEYLGKFANLIRTYLNHSIKGNITLQEEIDCLEMYLELEKLRFEEKLNYTIVSYGNLHPSDINIPTMLIQPYVENALKHGLLHRKINRVLKVNFHINDKTNVVKCIIIDNGVGREKAEKFKARSYKKHKPFATKATEDRLALLNYGKEKQVGVIITDLFEDNNPVGTQVTISIPFTTL
ncbi:histidine kinase [Polaribacter sp. MSW13]|uniref:Histidine kinase n=1 Tax=Polaribacter marinus TaxID=2916838 RepID=A0A9X1VPP4_9FLAO|nr:histidine kinase [Polaribacter marinus]MCI2229985.1 histidine kinase [Polaribacter marinus]